MHLTQLGTNVFCDRYTADSRYQINIYVSFVEIQIQLVCWLPAKKTRWLDEWENAWIHFICCHFDWIEDSRLGWQSGRQPLRPESYVCTLYNLIVHQHPTSPVNVGRYLCYRKAKIRTISNTISNFFFFRFRFEFSAEKIYFLVVYTRPITNNRSLSKSIKFTRQSAEKKGTFCSSVNLNGHLGLSHG